MDFTPIPEAVNVAFRAMTWQEAVAVFFGLIYIYFAAKGKIYCWPAALVSVCLYIYLCIKAHLYAETFLQVYYFIMAIYGWYSWNKTRKQATHGHIITWPLRYHVILNASGWLAVGLVGYCLHTYTDAAKPYFDTFTTVFSMITTYMVARRVLENWIYWFIIDGASIYLYFTRELYLTSLLFVFYTIIVLFGYRKWRKMMVTEKK